MCDIAPIAEPIHIIEKLRKDLFKDSHIFLDYPIVYKEREKIIKEANIFLDLFEIMIANINNDNDDDTNYIYKIHAKQSLKEFFDNSYLLEEPEEFLEILKNSSDSLKKYKESKISWKFLNLLKLKLNIKK